MRILTLLVLCAAPAAFGGLMTLPGANDTVDFSALTVTTNLGGSFVALSANGVSVTIAEPSSSFVVDKQGAQWIGNFPAGAIVIYDQGPNNFVTFTFSSPIKGIGFNIDDAFGGNYQGTIIALNGNTPVSSLTTVPLPPGLIFLSVVDATADITSVEIGTTAIVNNTFAFGNLAMIDTPITNPGVPEPASLSIVLIGLISLAGVARLRLR